MTGKPTGTLANLAGLLVSSMTAIAAAPLAAQAADAVLSGTITSASGEKMAGVTVSAKPEGSTITTSVYTDAAGQLLFPADAGGQIPGLGAGADVRALERRGRSCRRAARRPRAQADHRSGDGASGRCQAKS